MPRELDQILFSFEDKNFINKIAEIRLELNKAAAFSAADPQTFKNLQKVRQIFSDIIQNGDKAIIEYTKQFDNVNLTKDQLKIEELELKQAHKNIDAQLLASIKKSISNVRKYQSEIFIGDKNQHPGIKYTPIQKVGICIPGASAPLPSTVIMTAVPAQVAGVEQIVVVSPPRYNGSIHPTILAVCYELGITDVYRVGGVQAVAALAFEAENISIPKVYKIVGPGNWWVQAAKREAFGYVDIDSIAGPSEVLIIADANANPAWIAADMLSQAEHNPGSGLVFTDSKDLADKILAELQTQVSKLSRSKETIECLKQFSGIFVFENLNAIIEHANDFASEHLEIQCGDNSKNIADKIINAGAIFIGPYTPVAVGDYFAGPSHTLPTGMTAKFFSPLSANDFIKSSSIIEYTKDDLFKSADDIINLAQAEGLDAHANSIRIRKQK